MLDRNEQRGPAPGAWQFVLMHLVALAVLSYVVIVECEISVVSLCLGFLTGEFPGPSTYGIFGDVVVTIFYLVVSLKLLVRLGRWVMDIN